MLYSVGMWSLDDGGTTMKESDKVADAGRCLVAFCSANLEVTGAGPNRLETRKRHGTEDGDRFSEIGDLG